jgi:exoribonuclease R
MPKTLRADPSLVGPLSAGLSAIRAEFGVREDFPAQAQAEADERASNGPLAAERVDLTDVGFVTLDPASSTDLDQAFFVERDGDNIVLHYAIADVSAWVTPGGAIETESWLRGVTVYAPDGSVPLYPRSLSSGVASLLPDGPRPAVVLEVGIDPNGVAVLRQARRAMVRSRAKLAYETTAPSALPGEVGELARRVAMAERARGAFRAELTEQEVRSGPHGVELVYAARQESEDVNAGMSLAANLAVADAMSAGGFGLYRVMDEPAAHESQSLRRTANSLGLRWPKSTDLREFVPSLDASEPKAAAFLRTARRAGGGASYVVRRSEAIAAGTEPRPWHAAMAAPYAHATAPLRRLADRYVLDLICTQTVSTHTISTQTVSTQTVSTQMTSLTAAFEKLPDVMDRSEDIAARVDRSAVDLAECLVLGGSIGHAFDAVVLEPQDRNGFVTIQLDEPAVRARTKLRNTEPGDQVRVRLTEIDQVKRRLRFDRI